MADVCKYVTARGECMRRVEHNKTCCWQHLVATAGVELKPSQCVPGATGIFAARAFTKDEMIGFYDVSRQQLKKLLKPVDLSKCASKVKSTIHARCLKYFRLRRKCYPNVYANTAGRSRLTRTTKAGKTIRLTNAYYAASSDFKHIVLVASRQIRKGSEIVVNHNAACPALPSRRR